MKSSTISILVSLAMFAGIWIGAGLYVWLSWRGVAFIAGALLIGVVRVWAQSRKERAPP